MCYDHPFAFLFLPNFTGITKVSKTFGSRFPEVLFFIKFSGGGERSRFRWPKNHLHRHQASVGRPFLSTSVSSKLKRSHKFSDLINWKLNYVFALGPKNLKIPPKVSKLSSQNSRNCTTILASDSATSKMKCDDHLPCSQGEVEITPIALLDDAIFSEDR